MIYDTIKFLNLEDLVDIIESIDLIKNSNVLSCNLTLKKRNEPCPACNSNTSTVHGYYVKKITHSISNSSPCFIMYKARRYKCKFCSKVYYENNLYYTCNAQSSIYNILEVLYALLRHTSTFTFVSAQFNLTKQQIMLIFDSYVDVSTNPYPEAISIDEFYTSKLARHKY